MATSRRCVLRLQQQQKLIQNLPCYLRKRLLLHTAPSPLEAVSSLNFDDNKSTNNFAAPVTNSDNNKIIDLDDFKALFSRVPTKKLLKSSATLQMAAYGPMVDLGMWVMNSSLIRIPILKEMILGSIESSFYEHFVAGKDLEQVNNTIKRLWGETGLRSMLDYGLEHSTDNESCDRNTIEFIKTIDSTKSLPPSSVSHPQPPPSLSLTLISSHFLLFFLQISFFLGLIFKRTLLFFSIFN